MTYFGCHFPADAEYAERLAAEALKVGRRLAREGAIGRAAVDFVAVKRGALWRPYAVEINLRCGGTTHPLFALTGADRRRVRAARRPSTGRRYGDIKRYAATDHLDSPAYRSLTPDDLLDVVAANAARLGRRDARRASCCTWSARSRSRAASA